MLNDISCSSCSPSSSSTIRSPSRVVSPSIISLSEFVWESSMVNVFDAASSMLDSKVTVAGESPGVYPLLECCGAWAVEVCGAGDGCGEGCVADECDAEFAGEFIGLLNVLPMPVVSMRMKLPWFVMPAVEVKSPKIVSVAFVSMVVCCVMLMVCASVILSDFP